MVPIWGPIWAIWDPNGPICASQLGPILHPYAQINPIWAPGYFAIWVRRILMGQNVNENKAMTKGRHCNNRERERERNIIKGAQLEE